MATLNLGAFAGASGGSVIGYSTGNDTFYSSLKDGNVKVADFGYANQPNFAPDATNGHVTAITYNGSVGWSIMGGTKHMTSIELGDGADILNMDATSEEGLVIDTGAGNDGVGFAAATAGKVTVRAGAGSDSVDISNGIKDDATIELGEGADTLLFGGGSGNLVVSGSGNNSISITGPLDGNVEIQLEDGNDELITDEVLTGTVNMGNGNNLINEIKSNPSFSSATVITGDGKDTVYANSVVSSTINTGAGNDLVGIDDHLSDSTIDLGDGNDFLELGNPTDAHEGISNSTILGGAGNDTVMLMNTPVDSSVVDLGEGNDLISLGSTFDGNLSIYTGDGKDTINVASITSGTVTAVNLDLTNDVVKVSDNAINYYSFTADGQISLISGGAVKVSEINGYYAARIVNDDPAKIGAWGAESGSLIDASSLNESVVLLGTSNEEAVDTLIGGSKQDEIAAGAGDYIYGGGGNDEILLNAKLSSASADIEDILKGKATATGLGTTEYVGLAASGGKDTVLAFEAHNSSVEGDVVYLLDGGFDNFKLSTANGNKDLVVKSGSATLTLASVNGGTAISDDITINVLDAAGTGGTTTIDYVQGKASISNTDEMAKVYYAGTKSANLDFGSLNDDLVVDLGNNGVFGNTGDAYYYGSFASVKGGKSTTMLLGAAGTSETLMAGSGDTTLWGGGSKGDLLYGNGTSSSDSFVTYVYAAGDGKDSIDNGDWGSAEDDDVLMLYNGTEAISSIKNDGTNTTIKFSTSGDQLTIKNYGKSSSDSIIKVRDVPFSMDLQFKIGVSGQSNTWTFNENVNGYLGGKNNTLKVGSDVDTANIWLDGSTGTVYEGIKYVDASTNSGSVLIAGTSGNESLVGGKGETSLWGGAGNDTLKGISGGTTEFYFGMGDGTDVITNTYSDDKVVLYNVALSDIAALDDSKSGTMKIQLNDGSKLTINSMSSSSVHTFQLGDGSTWSYNYSKKTWSEA